MDWQLSVVAPAITPAFWGLIRTPEEKRDMAAIKASQQKNCCGYADHGHGIGKAQFLAGHALCHCDIPGVDAPTAIASGARPAVYA